MKTRPITSSEQPTPPSDDRTESLGVATVAAPRVACAGDAPPDDHPLIYMAFGDEREVVCPYCSRRYRLADGVPSGPLHH
jgi:uncharacterized Zn-finger protein